MEIGEIIERLRSQLEARPKRINVDVGFKIVEDDKPTFYYASNTNEGMCYKDESAWKNDDDICYIPECEFDGEGWGVEYREGLGYTKEEILNCVRDTIHWEYDGMPKKEDFIFHIAECVFMEAEWESIGVALDRIDLEEEWECFYGEKCILSK